MTTERTPAEVRCNAELGRPPVGALTGGEIAMLRAWAEDFARAERMAERAAWVTALDSEMVCCHLGVFDLGTHSPREVMNRLLAFHQDVALDPDVSAEAQALIDRGAAQERERLGDWLLKMHERDGIRHNYWMCAWRELYEA